MMHGNTNIKYTVCPLPTSNQLVTLATQSLFIGTVIRNT